MKLKNDLISSVELPHNHSDDLPRVSYAICNCKNKSLLLIAPQQTTVFSSFMEVLNYDTEEWSYCNYQLHEDDSKKIMQLIYTVRSNSTRIHRPYQYCPRIPYRQGTGINKIFIERRRERKMRVGRLAVSLCPCVIMYREVYVCTNDECTTTFSCGTTDIHSSESI